MKIYIYIFLIPMLSSFFVSIVCVNPALQEIAFQAFMLGKNKNVVEIEIRGSAGEPVIVYTREPQAGWPWYAAPIAFLGAGLPVALVTQLLKPH